MVFALTVDLRGYQKLFACVSANTPRKRYSKCLTMGLVLLYSVADLRVQVSLVMLVDIVQISLMVVAVVLVMFDVIQIPLMSFGAVIP